ncbi:M14 family metallopeptidase [Psychroflexus planctonicus]|uniref:M14 family metallopeptidase n=1 Tax=Psychroflexus planctonicus TaxID=1526575 RepID=UPI001E28C31C|nr:M14 family metallopeptidase [Psychroflexus planctonicus]
MYHKILILLVVSSLHSCKNKSEFTFPIAFEASSGKQTSNYAEVLQFYSEASAFADAVSLKKIKNTDSGEELQLVSIKPEKPIKNPLKILILNGIHPGESDGIDASMLLVKKIINKEFKLPNEIELNIVPIYNIGGALNRNKFTRANQNGPEEYGFRGNALNYDLNRDFIKSDSKNSKAFYQIFHTVNPDVFIDTHVSNGADYQYILTHLFTQSQQLGGNLGAYISTDFIPKLEDNLQSKNLSITPYVNVFNQTPKKGFTQFLDTPRYSTGYTSLWNSLGLMIETHMLKPYPKRVNATLEMLESVIELSSAEAEEIQLKRAQNFEKYLNAKNYNFNFKVDTTKHETFSFLAYEATQEISEVTGKNRLKYQTDKPITYPVKYYNYFSPAASVEIPKAYVIPKAYHNIIELFKLNNIKMNTFQKDSILAAEVYYIDQFETRTNPYEGHYLHYNTDVKNKLEKIEVKSGDVLVNTNQPGIRYLLETLEPKAVDSFFNWNFFDAILQQKEGFSPYVFEDEAAKILNENPKLKTEFEALKKNDSLFGNNAYAQLNWIYKHSKFYEKAHNRYPIYRILE